MYAIRSYYEALKTDRVIEIIIEDSKKQLMRMDKVLFGDNQFFAVNHLSDEKSREQAIRFKDDATIIKVLDQAMETGINTFMCTTP